MKLPAIALPTRPKGLRFEVSAVADARFVVNAEASTIEIFDVIGGPGVTDARVAAALRSIGPRPVTVQVNSGGGDPFVAAAIYNLLRGHGHKITTQILGMAASAASVVAMAGDRVETARNGQFMIHRAQGAAFGDADTMITVAALLDQTDTAIAGVYQARTGLPAEQIRKMMADETFMSADDMLALGFADGLLDRDATPPPQKVAADTPQNKRDLEAQLRAAGFSKSVSAKIVAGGFNALASELDQAPIAAALRAHAKQIENLSNRT